MDTRKKWKEPVARFITSEAVVLSDTPIDLKALAGMFALLAAKIHSAIRANTAAEEVKATATG